jgi:PmbA protein
VNTPPQDLLDLAERVVAKARREGADEVVVAVSQGSHVTLQRRARKVEQATEATTRGLSLSILADDRYTNSSTSDLRPDALDTFVRRCVEAARVLEPDPDRRLPDAAWCGRGVTEEALDQDDPAWARRTAEDRARQATEIEESLLNSGRDDVISATSYVADGRSEVVRVQSNGFADATRGAWFSASSEITLAEGDKRPEASAHYACRHLSDLPAVGLVAHEAVERVEQRLGAKPAPSGAYAMLLENRVAGQILGSLGGPLSGAALHEGRSCLADRLETAIASDVLTIVDDPTIPRGLGSRPWDGDALVAKPMAVLERGVLQTYYVSVYYGRKLGVPPTTGGRSNWVVAPGTRSPAAIARDLDQAILVTGFIGGNSNSTTGDFSYGIRGLLLERGEVVAPLSEMNVSGNLLRLLGQLEEVADDPWMWSSIRSPTLLFRDVQFSGT